MKKKKKGYEKYMEKKKMLSGKRIVEIAPAKEKHQVTGKYNFNKDFLLYPPLTSGSATHVLFFIILFLLLFKLATSPIFCYMERNSIQHTCNDWPIDCKADAATSVEQAIGEKWSMTGEVRPKQVILHGEMVFINY